MKFVVIHHAGNVIVWVHWPSMLNNGRGG